MALTAKAQEILDAPAEKRNELIEANIDHLSLSDIGEMSEIIINQLKPIMEQDTPAETSEPNKPEFGSIGPKFARSRQETDERPISNEDFEEEDVIEEDDIDEELDEDMEEELEDSPPRRRLKRQSTLSVFASGLPFPIAAALGTTTGVFANGSYPLPVAIIAGSIVVVLVCLLSGLIFRTVARDNVRWATAVCAVTSLAYVLPFIPGLGINWGNIASQYAYLLFPTFSCLSLFLALRK